jgi:putative DNA primase/helicase
MMDTPLSLSQEEQLKTFLETLFTDVSQSLFKQFFFLPSKRSIFQQEIDDRFISKLIGWAEHEDVYVAVGLSERDFGTSARCPKDKIAGIPGLWLDIDVRSPCHKKQNLPPTDNAALDFLRELGPSPTMVVHSGHGLQAWWLFREPWIFDSPEERSQAGTLAKRWNATAQLWAKEHRWDVDATHDLARLMRLPGLWNRKDEPVPTRLLEVRP